MGHTFTVIIIFLQDDSQTLNIKSFVITFDYQSSFVVWRNFTQALGIAAITVVVRLDIKIITSEDL